MSVGPREVQVREEIARYWAFHDCAPRSCDLEAATGLSRRQVEWSVNKLVEAGIATRDPKRRRTLRLVRYSQDDSATLLQRNYESAIRATARTLWDRLAATAREQGHAQLAQELADGANQIVRGAKR